jgi:hypothetical protein
MKTTITIDDSRATNMPKNNKPIYKNYKDLNPDELLDLYPDVYYECRIQHDWPTKHESSKEGGKVVWQYVGPGLIDRTIACKRCGSRKTEHYNTHFERVKSSDIRYSPGYLTPRTGLTKTDFRASWFGNEFKEMNQAGRVLGYHEEDGSDGAA